MTMDDLISRSAVIEYFARDFGCHFPLYDGTRLGATQLLVSREDVISAISHNIPAIDAEPVRHGRWVQEDEDMWVCSACGNAWTFIVDGPTENGAYYCPNCGAKMDGGDPHV